MRPRHSFKHNFCRQPCSIVTQTLKTYHAHISWLDRSPCSAAGDRPLPVVDTVFVAAVLACLDLGRDGGTPGRCRAPCASFRHRVAAGVVGELFHDALRSTPAPATPFQGKAHSWLWARSSRHPPAGLGREPPEASGTASKTPTDPSAGGGFALASSSPRLTSSASFAVPPAVSWKLVVRPNLLRRRD